jgi:hypothetical protein
MILVSSSSMVMAYSFMEPLRELVSISLTGIVVFVLMAFGTST